MKYGKNEEFMSLETGEIIGHIISPIYKKHLKDNEWSINMSNGSMYLGKLMNEKKLQGVDIMIFLYLIAKLDFENNIYISQKEIAEHYNMSKPNVSIAISKLVKLGIIHKGVKLGMSGTYILDPMFGYKGRAKNMNKLERNIQKNNIIKIKEYTT